MVTKIAIRLRLHPPKRRSAIQRLKTRLYYRKNRTKIRMQRRRYLRQHRSMLKRRKLFRRYKPSWYRHPKKPHSVHPRKLHPTKVKMFIPKHHTTKK